MIKRILAVLAVLAALTLTAAPANAATVNFNWTGSQGQSIGTNDFIPFLQQHPGQWIGVCATYRPNGGNGSVQVALPGAWSVNLPNVGPGGFVTRCGSAYNPAGAWGTVKVFVGASAGATVTVQSVSLS